MSVVIALAPSMFTVLSEPLFSGGDLLNEVEWAGNGSVLSVHKPLLEHVVCQPN